MNSELHIGIVGAGISGLRCATKLSQYGFNVTIIEARDRFGGRVCQSNKLGYPIDLGPQWIHTSGDNPLLKIAKQTATPLHSWNEYINLYGPTGNLIPKGKAVELDELRWRLVEEAMMFSLENEKEISQNESLFDFIARRVTEVLPDETDQALLLGIVEMWGDYIGDSVYRQSLKFLWMEKCCGGEELIVTSTFKAILDSIIKEALNATTNVLLGQHVVGIRSTSTSSDAKAIHLLTRCGNTYSFDGLVLTTPLGWLKRNQAAFTPPLNTRLLGAIDSISVGHLEKVYVTFPKAFWQEQPDRCSQPDTTLLAAQDTGSEFAGYTNWISPEYATSTNLRKWPQEAYNLAAFAEPYRHPTLLFYQFGDQSAYITAKVHGMSTKDHHAFLEDFYKPYFSRLNNYNKANPDCQPSAILSTSWYQDELAGYGSYCNFQIGVNDARGDVEALREGCPDRKIWFAGEHCAPFDEMGTATGAYLSGETVAEKVATTFRKMQ